jgi:hypothetical protein
MVPSARTNFTELAGPTASTARCITCDAERAEASVSAVFAGGSASAPGLAASTQHATHRAQTLRSDALTPDMRGA